MTFHYDSSEPAQRLIALRVPGARCFVWIVEQVQRVVALCDCIHKVELSQSLDDFPL
jgi:hypothetical protein